MWRFVVFVASYRACKNDGGVHTLSAGFGGTFLSCSSRITNTANEVSVAAIWRSCRGGRYSASFWSSTSGEWSSNTAA